MTERVPPGLEGQIDQPNPLELFWERHRTKIIAALVVAGLVVIAVYGWQYMGRQEANRAWSAFAATANLDDGYVENGSLYPLVSAQDRRQRVSYLGFYLSSTQAELIHELTADVREADEAELHERLEEARGKPTEPLLLWIAANRAALEQEWDEALGHLDDLASRFPGHFLCHESEYPVQWRRDRNAEKEEQQRRSKRPPKPDLVEPVEGSPVALLRRQIEKEKAFREAHPRLYQPPPPDPSPTVVVKTTMGEFKIRFYTDAAPRHVAHFLKLFREDDGAFYVGQRIDEIQRAGSEGSSFGAAGETPMQIRFGLPSSREDDRSKWDASKPSGTTLEFEFNDLSHFPGMVAAAPEPGGEESSGERIWITVNDAAHRFDGERVIFGRVVEGLETLRQIAESPLLSEEEERAGRGKPRDNIEIEAIEVVE